MAKTTLIVHPWTNTILNLDDGVLRVELDNEHPQFEDDAWVVQQAVEHGTSVA